MEGILVPLITPFAADGTIATDALAALADDVLAQGAAGIVALGTTGEPFALDADEKRTVLDICARACADHGASLVVGAGTSDTSSSASALAAYPKPMPRWCRCRTTCAPAKPASSRTSRGWPPTVPCRCSSTTCRTARPSR
ncbi:dihydrodipicolinate synthase family protein [Kutzneria chonburiensis]|uniref:dihydrodipicolinate synthase family protein n=1 Tax=Kutzneria chonburiensis TaxID=1483604 RepID=UPI0023613F9D|nr:dihydrodipicolinate synthase family protein [Kutzneria chonburiensis]